MKHGFTLIEILIVLAIFAVLLVAGTDFLILVVQNANKATIENEVRQNASYVMQDIVNSIRSSACVEWTVTTTDRTIKTYSDNCNTKVHEYIFFDTGVVQKDTKQISANGVVFLDCTNGSTCSKDVCVSGLSIFGSTKTNKAVNLIISAQAATANRSDFCAQTKLTDTVTPRVQY